MILLILMLGAQTGVAADGTDLFSVNFYAFGNLQPNDRAAVTLEIGEVAGVGQWSAAGWHNIFVPWHPSSPQPDVEITSSEGAKARLTLNDARNGGPYELASPHTQLPGDGNGDLMDGHANGTMESPGDVSNIFDVTVSDVPYATFHVIVYLGANRGQFGDGTGKLVLNGGAEQDFTLPPGEFSSFAEIVDTTTPGNYIVLEDVPGPSFNLKVWGNGFNHIGPCGLQIFVPDTSIALPDQHVITALTQLTEHVRGTLTLNTETMAAHRATIESEMLLFSVSENVKAAAIDLVNCYETNGGPFFVAGKTVGGFTREPQKNDEFDLERVVYVVQQAVLDRVFEASSVQRNPNHFDGVSFRTAEFFPGSALAPADSNVTYQVSINATLPAAWGKPVLYDDDPVRRPTGCYLAPGSLGRVTVPPAMVNQGFEILVGAHTRDKSNKSTIERFDRITKSYPVNSQTTVIANPFGGGIYIVVPHLAALSVVQVEIANVIRSPFFSATASNQTTLEEWRNTERRHPAPWADFESDKFMMQVPTSWIYNFSDPVTLMNNWDRAMDGMSELLGYPSIRNRTVLYVQPDISIAHLNYGVGYPQINQIFDPGRATDGNSSHFFLTDPIGWATTYHELGHAQLFSKFPGHEESMVNLPYVYIATEKFGVDLVTAFTASMNLSHLENVDVDQAALTWFVTENFRNGLPMDISNSETNQVRYQHRGYGRYVDIAMLFGWDVLRDFYRQEQPDYISGTQTDSLSAVDSRILRLSKAAGVDLTPLIHCWGVHPVDTNALKTAIAAAGLEPSLAIYNRLTHYRDIIPANNLEFRQHYRTIFPSQPEGGNPLFHFGWYNVWKSIYDSSEGSAAKQAMQEIIDRYFDVATHPTVDVVGMARSLAESSIIGAGNTVGTVTIEYSSTAPVGHVISQVPAAGTQVLPGSAVRLLVSLGEFDADIFSVNFFAYGSLGAADYGAVTLASNEAAGAGVWNTTGWNNISVPWHPAAPQPAVAISSSRGAAATLTLNDARNGGPYELASPHTQLPGDGNGDLMDGHANGTMETPGDVSNIFDVTVSGVPYANFDVIVYLGANRAQFGDGSGTLVLNGGAVQDFKLQAGEFSVFKEITDATTPGNYVVLEGVSGPAFNLRVWGKGFNHIGPTGIQLIEDGRGFGYPSWAVANKVGAAHADPDGDNRSNFHEYAWGGSPTTTLDVVAEPGLVWQAGKLNYVYMRRNDDPNLSYVLEARTNLTSGSWIVVAPDATKTNSTVGAYDEVMRQIPTNSQTLFFRMTITNR